MIAYRVFLWCDGVIEIGTAKGSRPCLAPHPGIIHDDPAAMVGLSQNLINLVRSGSSTGAGWTIEGECHYCPRCSENRREGKR